MESPPRFRIRGQATEIRGRQEAAGTRSPGSRTTGHRLHCLVRERGRESASRVLVGASHAARGLASRGAVWASSTVDEPKVGFGSVMAPRHGRLLFIRPLLAVPNRRPRAPSYTCAECTTTPNSGRLSSTCFGSVTAPFVRRRRRATFIRADGAPGWRPRAPRAGDSRRSNSSSCCKRAKSLIPATRAARSATGAARRFPRRFSSRQPLFPRRCTRQLPD